MGGPSRHIGMKSVIRAAATLTLGIASLLLQAPSASALSCVAPKDWFPKASHVFVGRVSDVRGDTMQLEVGEVWQGEDLARHVWLRRAEDMDTWYPFSADGGVPDGYSSPKQYVVATQGFEVSPCGMWGVDEPMEYGVAGQRSPRPPVASGATGVEPGERSSVPMAAAAGAGVIGLGTLMGLLWRRRTR